MFKFPDVNASVDTIVKLADKARREGLLALEEAAKDVEDDFLRDGLQSAIDGTDPDDLRDMLEARSSPRRPRDKVSAKFFARHGRLCADRRHHRHRRGARARARQPATPDELGEMIGSAFVATLWGLLTANLIWLPIACAHHAGVRARGRAHGDGRRGPARHPGRRQPAAGRPAAAQPHAAREQVKEAA